MRNPLTTLLAGALVLGGCSAEQAPQDTAAAPQPATPPAVQAAPQQTLAEIYSEGTRSLFRARPMSATNYGMDPGQAGGYYADRLGDYSPAAEQALRDAMRQLQRDIENWPQPADSAAQRTDREIMANVARYFAGHEDFPIGYIDVWMGLSPFVVSQINGPLIDVPRSLENNHAVNSERDAQDYLARLADFDRFIDSVIARLQADAERGWVAPKVILQGALGYVQRFTAAEPGQHPLATSFAEKLAQLDSLTEAQRDQLLQQAVTQIGEVVYPAYARMVEATAALLPKAPQESGIWAQPEGAKYYRDAIRFLGDSELSADEIHAVGLAEIERITAEMDTILRAEGYTEGSVGERMVALSEEERFLFEDSPQGRQALLDYVNGEIEKITERMAPWFRTAPPYAVEVRAYPVEIQDGMPGGEYQSPSIDGSKPGIYWINLRDMKGVPRFALKTLTYHEANPGHHWQVALNLAQTELPFLRRISPYNAYAEGWALYSEAVAKELGMYEDDPYGDLGRLQDELFRAVRLAVDTGLHHKRWSREEAITFMANATGKAESETVAEIERYMAWPGQALGYKMGMLKIQQLRARAESELGERFDLAGFHDLLLLDGAMPMSVLERRVDEWIAAQPAA